MDFRNLPAHHFRCILADPPWNHQNWGKAGEGRAACQHYGILKLGDIAAFPVRDVADVDCWLFLWCVTSMIPQAYFVMKEWGFSNSGIAFSWVKQNPSGNGYFMGLGHTTRKNIELMLLGRRGKPPRLHADVRELIVSPRREHSRKPDEQYARIERFCGGPRLELFARQRRPGWASWGLETEHFAQAAE